MQSRNLKSIQLPARQQGMVLLLGLLLLLTLTILGVSSFQNANLQERSASNARLQSVAFEAAAAGAASSINFFDAQRDTTPDDQCGALDHVGWADATDWVDVGSVGDATLKQRMYCLADTYPCVGESCVEARPARSQLFVLSRGEITSGGEVVAQRDIEVRLAVLGDGPPIGGDGCGAICLPSCEPGEDMEFPNSNAFRVDGNGGPAITGGCDEMTEAIDDAVRDNRIGNYIGGIATAAPGAPWDTPENVSAFSDNLAAYAQAEQAINGNCQTLCYHEGNYSDSGNNDYGTNEDPQITYIDGDASFGGNVSGAGILFVTGTLSWNGTPNFNGLMVTLGGTFHIDGGGQGGNFGGSVVILGTDGSAFTESDFQNTGGGTGDYVYDCPALLAARDMLDSAGFLNDGNGDPMWSPECDESGTGTPWEVPLESIGVASWRENVGWREEFFGADDEEG
ncbi:PilX N-terminal domain-containing pilus assembly protein [Marinihelvus fidelis]|nr:PilX N-terminal domain-containing pilus assembly protein [Marinihelvus fidelis]